MRRIAHGTLKPAAGAVEYPSSDGKPIAETDHHRTPLMYAVEALRCHFQDRADVYVSGNLFIYYREGDPRAVVTPDVFVVMGADSADRSIYCLWDEPKGPDFVLEITSLSTRREDQVTKRELYRSLGVREYWQFDPTDDYLEPPLQGLELVAGEYRRLPARKLADGTRALASAVLGLELRLSERGLRFHDPRAERELGTLAEVAESRLAREPEALRRETAARKAAEARVAELEARLRQAGD